MSERPGYNPKPYKGRQTDSHKMSPGQPKKFKGKIRQSNNTPPPSGPPPAHGGHAKKSGCPLSLVMMAGGAYGAYEIVRALI